MKIMDIIKKGQKEMELKIKTQAKEIERLKNNYNNEVLNSESLRRYWGYSKEENTNLKEQLKQANERVKELEKEDVSNCVFTYDDKLELRKLAKQVEYRPHTIKDMERIDELTRKKWAWEKSLNN